MTQYKESACNAGDVGLIPGLARSPGGGNGNPTHCSILGLGNPSDRGAWWAKVHVVAKSWTRLKQLMTCIQVPPAVDILLLFLEKVESISSWPRDRMFPFSIVRRILYHWATWEAVITCPFKKNAMFVKVFWSNSQDTIQGQSAYWLGCVHHWYISKEFFMEATNFWTSSILPPLFREAMIPPTDPCPFKEIILNSRALSRNLLF